MTDSNQNITRKFDLNEKKIKLKIDFDSSLTCYNLDNLNLKFGKKMDMFFFLELSSLLTIENIL
jgi:hypothetical protein